MKLLGLALIASTFNLQSCGNQSAPGNFLSVSQFKASNPNIPIGDLIELTDRITAIDFIAGSWAGQTELATNSGVCLLQLDIIRNEKLVKFTASTRPEISGAKCDDIGTASRDLNLEDRSNWIYFYTFSQQAASVGFSLKDNHVFGNLRRRSLDVALKRIDDNSLEISWLNIVNPSGTETGSTFGYGSNNILIRSQ